MSEPRLIKEDEEALGVWTRLTKAFPAWTLIFKVGFTRRGLYPWILDNMGVMRKTPHWKIGLGLLGGLNDDQIDFLEEYAEINARRIEHVFRAGALLLVSVPVGTLYALNEIAPGLFGVGTPEVSEVLFGILIGWGGVAILLMTTAWRARDLHDLLRFEKVRRKRDLEMQAEREG
jgi:hypothetical protein